MSESPLRVSETRPDNPDETADDFQSRKKSNNGVNSVRVSIRRNDDEPEIREDFKTSEKRSISREVDLGAALANLKRGNGELTRESWMKRDTSNFIGDVTDFQEAHFITGSSYEGSWDSLGMNGVGKYVMPNGTIYEGEIRDGMFHGQGSLYWPKNGRLDVVHSRGELKEYKYTFHDGLIYEENNWNYCTFPDRRFSVSMQKGLRPGGKTLKTGRQPNKVLPSGCYDTGDGVYDPKTMRIMSYDDSKKILRLPLKHEYEWIIKKCRKSLTEPTGYRPDLNENWSKNPPDLPYNIAMSKDSPDPSWQRLTTFERDPNFLGPGSEEDSNQSESRLSPEVCLCGQYVILGEPCHCMPIYGSYEAGEYEDSEKMSEKYLSKFYEENEVEKVKIFSGYASTGSTLDCETSAMTSRDNMLDEIYVIKKIKQSQIEKEIPKINLDFPLSMFGEISENSVTSESSKETRESKKRSKDSKALQLLDKVKREQEEEHRRREVGKEVLQKSNQDKELKEMEDNGKDVVKEQSPEKSSEKSDNNETLHDVIENQQLQKFSEKSGNGNIDQTEYEIEDKISKKVSEERHEEKDSKPDDFMEEKTFEKSAKESLTEMPDYEVVPREKVSVITEPEMANDRRLETKFLPKNIPDEYQDDPSTDSKTNENKSPFYSTSDEKTKENGDKIIAQSLRKEEKMDENIKSKSDDEELKDFHPDDLSEEMKKIQFHSQLEFVEEKSITESEKKLEKNDFELKETLEDHFSPDKLENEVLKMSENSETGKISLPLKSMTNKKSSSAIFEKRDGEKKSNSSEDDFSSLDKVHPSLATLVSTKTKKSSKEKEIIEIYEGKLKRKPKIESTTANVWRLSGVNQGYGPKTKIEDLLFHPALTAPRSENIEYVRKPCNFRVCKKTTREVGPTACYCRKEFDIPAKSVKSFAQKIINGKK